MMDPRRKSVAVAQTAATSLRKRAAARTTAGRWSLLCEEAADQVTVGGAPEERQRAVIEKAKQREAALEAWARILLCRYGVVFRDVLVREANAPKWRDLAPMLRRLEARGEIRGGRFVAGAFGEQFAVPEAVEGLREARRAALGRGGEEVIAVAAADALNLVGVIVPGEKVAAVPGKTVEFRNGASAVETPVEVGSAAKRRSRSVAEVLRESVTPVRARVTGAGSMELFG
jgi:ATP-dependent Lhr-like helicase